MSRGQQINSHGLTQIKKCFFVFIKIKKGGWGVKKSVYISENPWLIIGCCGDGILASIS